MDLKYQHLIGREYVPGKWHCYELVQDFYADNFAIKLPSFALPADWVADELDLISAIWDRTGADKVDDWTIRTLRPADVLALAVRSQNANHFAVYVGDNKFIHHPYMQASKEEPMRPWLRMSTCFVLRHPEVPNLTPQLPSVSILDLARARYNPLVAEA